MPFWFLPKEVGLKGAVYADAGGLYDYQGPTSWAATGEVNHAQAVCTPTTSNPPSPGTCLGLQYDDSKVVRYLGRCRPDLAVAVRSAALRLRDPADQGCV